MLEKLKLISDETLLQVMEATEQEKERARSIVGDMSGGKGGEYADNW